MHSFFILLNTFVLIDCGFNIPLNSRASEVSSVEYEERKSANIAFDFHEKLNEVCISALENIVNYLSNVMLTNINLDELYIQLDFQI